VLCNLPTIYEEGTQSLGLSVLLPENCLVYLLTAKNLASLLTEDLAVMTHAFHWCNEFYTSPHSKSSQQRNCEQRSEAQSYRALLLRVHSTNHFQSAKSEAAILVY